MVALRTHPLGEVIHKEKEPVKKFHSLDTDYVPDTELSIPQIWHQAVLMITSCGRYNQLYFTDEENGSSAEWHDLPKSEELKDRE